MEDTQYKMQLIKRLQELTEQIKEMNTMLVQIEQNTRKYEKIPAEVMQEWN